MFYFKLIFQNIIKNVKFLSNLNLTNLNLISETITRINMKSKSIICIFSARSFCF